MVVVGYYNKLPSGVSLPKHKSLFAIAYGATEAHPARYANVMTGSSRLVMGSKGGLRFDEAASRRG